MLLQIASISSLDLSELVQSFLLCTCVHVQLNNLCSDYIYLWDGTSNDIIVYGFECPEPSALEPLTTVDRIRALSRYRSSGTLFRFPTTPKVKLVPSFDYGMTMDCITGVSLLTRSDNGRDIGRHRPFA